MVAMYSIFINDVDALCSFIHLPPRVLIQIRFIFDYRKFVERAITLSIFDQLLQINYVTNCKD